MLLGAVPLRVIGKRELPPAYDDFLLFLHKAGPDLLTSVTCSLKK